MSEFVELGNSMKCDNCGEPFSHADVIVDRSSIFCDGVESSRYTYKCRSCGKILAKITAEYW